MFPMRDTRQLLLDTAERLFYAHGYHAVGIDRIVAESGVSKMTLYKHFPSKDALIAAVLERRDAAFRASLETFVASFDSARERLEAVFVWHERWFNEPTFNGCMFISAAAEYPAPDDPIHLAAKAHKEAIRKKIKDIVSPLADEATAERLAAQVLLLLEGAIVTALVLGEKDSPRIAWQATQAILMQAELGNGNLSDVPLPLRSTPTTSSNR